MHWRRKWQPTPVFLPGGNQGQGARWAVIYGVVQSWTRLKWILAAAIGLPSWAPPTVMWVKWMLLSHVQLLATPWTIAHCSLPGSSIHGVLQARILEWVAYPFSRGISLTQELNFSRGSSLCQGIKPSSALQTDSLPAELPGKPRFH